MQVRTFELHSYLPGLAGDEMRRLLRNKNLIMNRQPVFWQLLKNSESNEAMENGLVTHREWPHPCMVFSMNSLTWLIFTWTTILEWWEVMSGRICYTFLWKAVARDKNELIRFHLPYCFSSSTRMVNTHWYPTIQQRQQTIGVPNRYFRNDFCNKDSQ